MLPTIKVCGITREEDIRDCLAAGVYWLGINLYSPSPRSVSLNRARELCAIIPAGQRVLVDVTPDLNKLHTCLDIGFDRFQLHFSLDLPDETLCVWSELIGPENLWLAPKLPPSEPFPDRLLDHAQTIVLDTYSRDAFGGTGKIGNWSFFRNLKVTHPETNWVLAGGLNPENISDAVDQTGAAFLDLNSGIEVAPGIKDSSLLRKALGSLGRG